MIKRHITRLALWWLRRHSPQSLAYIIRPYTPKPKPVPEPQDIAAWLRTLQAIDTKEIE